MSLKQGLFKFRELKDDPKPFLEHLEELRRMLIKMGVVLGAAMILCFVFRASLLAVVQHPLASLGSDKLNSLQSLGVVDPLSISLELSFYAGIVVSFPILLYFLAGFVLPALTASERRHIWPAAAMGFGLFLSGVAFAYFVVLPQTLAYFFRDAQSLGWKPTWTVREYYSFTTQFIIAFGLAFELPVVVLLLVKMGILSAPDLKRLRPHAFVAVMVFAAVLTPTTDILTMLLMGIPMYFLYEACVIIAGITQRREAVRQQIEG